MAVAGGPVVVSATPDDVDDPVHGLFPANVVGVYRILEAARTAGAKRMILASSGQVVWGQRATGPRNRTTATPGRSSFPAIQRPVGSSAR